MCFVGMEPMDLIPFFQTSDVRQSPLMYSQILGHYIYSSDEAIRAAHLVTKAPKLMDLDHTFF